MWVVLLITLSSLSSVVLYCLVARLWQYYYVIQISLLYIVVMIFFVGGGLGDPHFSLYFIYSCQNKVAFRKSASLFAWKCLKSLSGAASSYLVAGCAASSYLVVQLITLSLSTWFEVDVELRLWQYYYVIQISLLYLVVMMIFFLVEGGGCLGDAYFFLHISSS